MQIGIVRVHMENWLVDVPMHVRLAWRVCPRVLVFVMKIV